MEFLVYEVAARLVAITLAVWCGRELWQALVSGKISSDSGDIFDPMLFSSMEFRKNANPVSYWTEIILKTVALLACIFVAVFGWFVA